LRIGSRECFLRFLFPAEFQHRFPLLAIGRKRGFDLLEKLTVFRQRDRFLIIQEALFVGLYSGRDLGIKLRLFRVVIAEEMFEGDDLALPDVRFNLPDLIHARQGITGNGVRGLVDLQDAAVGENAERHRDQKDAGKAEDDAFSNGPIFHAAFS
jgi:hypothetical protein